MDDLEFLAVRANATSNGLRVLEPLSANKGKTHFVNLNFDCWERKKWVFSTAIPIQKPINEFLLTLLEYRE